MTAALTTGLGLEPHFKVRVVFVGAIEEPSYGDTLGYIDWSAVSAVSWRWSE